MKQHCMIFIKYLFLSLNSFYSSNNGDGNFEESHFLLKCFEPLPITEYAAVYLEGNICSVVTDNCYVDDS